MALITFAQAIRDAFAVSLAKDSGVMVFGKTAAANRSLTRQFEERKVRKKYVILHKIW